MIIVYAIIRWSNNRNGLIWVIQEELGLSLETLFEGSYILDYLRYKIELKDLMLCRKYQHILFVCFKTESHWEVLQSRNAWDCYSVGLHELVVMQWILIMSLDHIINKELSRFFFIHEELFASNDNKLHIISRWNHRKNFVLLSSIRQFQVDPNHIFFYLLKGINIINLNLIGMTN